MNYTRQTSVDAYSQILAGNLLSKRRMEVYEILFHHGPMTANEIVRKSKTSYPDTNPSSFHARLSELKKLGAISEIGEKRDVVSGQTCYVWDLTDNLPKDAKLLSNPKKQRVKKAINALKELYDGKNRDKWLELAELIKAI